MMTMTTIKLCEHSFISPINGYRYCGDPEVMASLGYHPYCPGHPGIAFKCPRGCYKHIVQTNLSMFVGGA